MQLFSCFYFSKWRPFEKKKVIFDLYFTCFSHQGKDTKNPSAYTHLLTYFAHPIDFFAFSILQKLRMYHVWFLFGVTLVLILYIKFDTRTVQDTYAFVN